MRIASLSVGVVAYDHAAYRESGMRLRYATDDAKAFHRYASTAGEAADARHPLLVDEQANLQAMASSLAQIVAGGPVDTLLVYLSGHGEPDGWFCLADAVPGQRSLSGNTLADLLDQVEASNVVVFVDSCYAERLIADVVSGRSLNGGNCRVFVASARADQQSWEDESLKRSIFSDVLLRTLSSSSGATTALVDLERDVLPVLREQVPLLTAHRKGGRIQEPVSAGVIAAPVLLPKVDSRSLGRTLSITEVIRKRVSQVLIGASITAAVLLLGLDTLTYHMAVGAGGEIEVRPGIVQIHDLMPFHLVPRSDTGLNLGDIKQGQDPFLSRLASGAIWGLRLDSDADGLKTWLGQLEPALTAAKSASVSEMARGRAIVIESDESPAPILETAFLAKLSDKPPSQVAESTYRLDPVDPVPCTASPMLYLDFVQLQPDDAVFMRDASWFGLTLPVGEEEVAFRVASVTLTAAYRAAHADDDAGGTVEALAAFIGAVRGRLSGDEVLRARVEAELQKLNIGWCRRHAIFALAALGGSEASAAAEAVLWTWLAEDGRRQRDGDRPILPLAGQLLAHLSTYRSLDQTSVETLGEQFIADDELLLTASPQTLLLDSLIEKQAMPLALAGHLAKRLDVDPEEFDFVPLAAIRALACNASFLALETKQVVSEWLKDNAQQNATIGDVQAAMGCAARWGPPEPDQIALLSANLSPQSRFPVSATTYRGTQIVSSSGDAAAVALGQVAQRTSLNMELVERLATIASLRSRMDGRGNILLGLGAQWYPSTSFRALDGYDRLCAALGDAVRRRLESEVLAVRVTALPQSEAQSALDELIEAWRQETRPELRVGLAETIALIILPRT